MYTILRTLHFEAAYPGFKIKSYTVQCAGSQSVSLYLIFTKAIFTISVPNQTCSLKIKSFVLIASILLVIYPSFRGGETNYLAQPFKLCLPLPKLPQRT